MKTIQQYALNCMHSYKGLLKGGMVFFFWNKRGNVNIYLLRGTVKRG